MLEPEALAAQGLLYARRDFLAPAECLALQTIMLQAPRVPSKSYFAGEGHVVDTQFRSTKEADVPASAREAILARILMIRHEMERYFGLMIQGMEPSQFLVYQSGDFFKPHKDRYENHAGVKRQISLVVFVNAPETNQASHQETSQASNQANAQETEPASEPVKDPYAGLWGYRGGEIVFYRPARRPPHQLVGMPLRITPGMLVAFRPDLMHGVQEVTAGERLTVVSWLT